MAPYEVYLILASAIVSASVSAELEQSQTPVEANRPASSIAPDAASHHPAQFPVPMAASLSGLQELMKSPFPAYPVDVKSAKYEELVRRRRGANCRKLEENTEADSVPEFLSTEKHSSSDAAICYLCRNPRSGEAFKHCTYAFQPHFNKYLQQLIGSPPKPRLRRSSKNLDSEYLVGFPETLGYSGAGHFSEPYGYGTDTSHYVPDTSHYVAEENKENPQKCESYRKNDMVCTVCNDPVKNGKYEQCSFETDPKNKAYSYSQSRSSGNPRNLGQVQVDGISNNPLTRTRRSIDEVIGHDYAFSESSNTNSFSEFPGYMDSGHFPQPYSYDMDSFHSEGSHHMAEENKENLQKCKKYQKNNMVCTICHDPIKNGKLEQCTYEPDPKKEPFVYSQSSTSEGPRSSDHEEHLEDSSDTSGLYENGDGEGFMDSPSSRFRRSLAKSLAQGDSIHLENREISSFSGYPGYASSSHFSEPYIYDMDTILSEASFYIPEENKEIPQQCEKYTKDNMICRTCKDPISNAKYEKCSFASVPEKKIHSSLNDRGNPIQDGEFPASSSNFRFRRSNGKAGQNSADLKSRTTSDFSEVPEFLRTDGHSDPYRFEVDGFVPEASHSVASASQECEKYSKGNMVCMICTDPTNNGKVEKCSLTTDPKSKAYSYAKSSSYGSPRPGDEERHGESSDLKSGTRPYYDEGYLEMTPTYRYRRSNSNLANPGSAKVAEVLGSPEVGEVKGPYPLDMNVFSPTATDLVGKEYLKKPQQCRKYLKDSMVCTICKDPVTNGKYEQCSYVSRPKDQAYTLKESSTFEAPTIPKANFREEPLKSPSSTVDKIYKGVAGPRIPQELPSPYLKELMKEDKSTSPGAQEAKNQNPEKRLASAGLEKSADCQQIQKSGMTCSICKDPTTGRNSEKCSYAYKPDDEVFQYKRSKTIGYPEADSKKQEGGGGEPSKVSSSSGNPGDQDPKIVDLQEKSESRASPTSESHPEEDAGYQSDSGGFNERTYRYDDEASPSSFYSAPYFAQLQKSRKLYGPYFAEYTSLYPKMTYHQDYSSSPERISDKLESAEETSGDCQKVEKDGMTCTNCKDPKTGRTSESCSYAHQPDDKIFKFSRSKSFGSPKTEGKKSEVEKEEAEPANKAESTSYGADDHQPERETSYNDEGKKYSSKYQPPEGDSGEDYKAYPGASDYYTKYLDLDPEKTSTESSSLGNKRSHGNDYKSYRNPGKYYETSSPSLEEGSTKSSAKDEKKVEGCKEVQRDGMICTVCQDPGSGDHSEKCSYKVEPSEKIYQYSTSKSFGNPKGQNKGQGPKDEEKTPTEVSPSYSTNEGASNKEPAKSSHSKKGTRKYHQVEREGPEPRTERLAKIDYQPRSGLGTYYEGLGSKGSKSFARSPSEVNYGYRYRPYQEENYYAGFGITSAEPSTLSSTSQSLQGESGSEGDSKFSDNSGEKHLEPSSSSPEQSSIKKENNSGGCKEVQKNGMTCTICHDPKTGGSTEKCSYADAPSEKTYQYSRSKSFGYPKDKIGKKLAKEKIESTETSPYNYQGSGERQSTIQKTAPKVADYASHGISGYRRPKSATDFNKDINRGSTKYNRRRYSGQGSGNSYQFTTPPFIEPEFEKSLDTAEGQTCEEIRKDAMVCKVCRNPRTGKKLEKCSLSLEPDTKRSSDQIQEKSETLKSHSLPNSRNSHKYSNARDSRNPENKGKKSSGESDNARQSTSRNAKFAVDAEEARKVGIESEKTSGNGEARKKPSIRDKSWKLRNHRDPYRYRVRASGDPEESKKASDSVEQATSQNANFALPNDQETEKAGSEAKPSVTGVDLVQSKTKSGNATLGNEKNQEVSSNSSREGSPESAGVTGAPHKKKIKEILKEFEKEDRSGCKKVTRGKMTCYQCLDGSDLRKEDCVFVATGPSESPERGSRNFLDFRKFMESPIPGEPEASGTSTALKMKRGWGLMDDDEILEPEVSASEIHQSSPEEDSKETENQTRRAEKNEKKHEDSAEDEHSGESHKEGSSENPNEYLSETRPVHDKVLGITLPAYMLMTSEHEAAFDEMVASSKF